MPLYLYQHPETGEVKEILQTMSEPHTYAEEGLDWKRIFTIPQGSIPIQIDPFSSKQFLDKTAQAKGNIGNLVDQAQELSHKRKERLGYDPVQNKFFDQWSKRRCGRKHPNDERR